MGQSACLMHALLLEERKIVVTCRVTLLFNEQAVLELPLTINALLL